MSPWSTYLLVMVPDIGYFFAVVGGLAVIGTLIFIFCYSLILEDKNRLSEFKWRYVLYGVGIALLFIMLATFTPNSKQLAAILGVSTNQAEEKR